MYVEDKVDHLTIVFIYHIVVQWVYFRNLLCLIATYSYSYLGGLQCSLLAWLFVFLIGLTVGFVPESYAVDESKQHVVFNITVVSGIVVRNVEIEFFTTDESALGNSP